MDTIDLARSAPEFQHFTGKDGTEAWYAIRCPQELVWYWDGNPHPCITISPDKRRLKIKAKNADITYARAQRQGHLWYRVRGRIDRCVLFPAPSNESSGYAMQQVVAAARSSFGGPAGGAGGRIWVSANQMTGGWSGGNGGYYPSAGSGLQSGVFTQAVMAVQTPGAVGDKYTREELDRSRKWGRTNAIAGAPDMVAKIRLIKRFRDEDAREDPEFKKTVEEQINAEVNARFARIAAKAPNLHIVREVGFLKQLAKAMLDLAGNYTFNLTGPDRNMATVDVLDNEAFTGKGPSGEYPGATRYPIQQFFKVVAATAQTLADDAAQHSSQPLHNPGAIQYSQGEALINQDYFRSDSPPEA
jgi:hypothetical protein